MTVNSYAVHVHHPYMGNWLYFLCRSRSLELFIFALSGSSLISISAIHGWMVYPLRQIATRRYTNLHQASMRVFGINPPDSMRALFCFHRFRPRPFHEASSHPIDVSGPMREGGNFKIRKQTACPSICPNGVSKL
ncbi:hypothetical protein BKA82DRAFT_208670 [Pisolithus tinctorius]|uniref:Uncharacterized protein n=1 Tax=Pisolithus tinctorius Marx 270 TaxID=870435 RepID=A0A0C3Q052_PISTI|nr:hypothetical protein BKA82DRAFT_208670 [Pisolithus tinctorius]KIO15209.1 hypothetical protein M404DRAFT_208670 [Pisolithus tinctorius Marx 270]